MVMRACMQAICRSLENYLIRIIEKLGETGGIRVRWPLISILTDSLISLLGGRFAAIRNSPWQADSWDLRSPHSLRIVQVETSGTVSNGWNGTTRMQANPAEHTWAELPISLATMGKKHTKSLWQQLNWIAQLELQWSNWSSSNLIKICYILS